MSYVMPSAILDRSVELVVGGRKLSCVVPHDYHVGLQRHRGLTDEQGMYFPYGGQTVSFHMGQVSFPIDMVFVRDGRIAKIVSNIQPGTLGTWGLEGCTGILEVRGGWCADHGVDIGTRLEGSL